MGRPGRVDHHVSKITHGPREVRDCAVAAAARRLAILLIEHQDSQPP